MTGEKQTYLILGTRSKKDKFVPRDEIDIKIARDFHDGSIMRWCALQLLFGRKFFFYNFICHNIQKLLGMYLDIFFRDMHVPT